MPRGRPFKPGNCANPNGRPRKGHAIADEMRRILEEERTDPSNPKRKLTGKALYVEAVFRRAINGDATAMRLIWDHVDGPPAQHIAADIASRVVVAHESVTDDGLQALEAEGNGHRAT